MTDLKTLNDLGSNAKLAAEVERLVLPYKGYVVKQITHPHFGSDPAHVFALDVAHDAPVKAASVSESSLEPIVGQQEQ